MLSHRVFFENLRVRKGGVVGALSALEEELTTDDAQRGLAVCRSELSNVFCVESPCRSPVQQRFEHLGCQQVCLRTTAGRLSYHTTSGLRT